MADVRPINFTATASESDLNSYNFLWLDTPQKAKKLPGNAVATRNVQDKLVRDFYPFMAESGYMGANGTITTASGYHCLSTDKITASAGDVFFYRGTGRSDAYSVVFFDSAGNVLSSEQYESASDYVAVTCPENTASVKFSSFEVVGSVVKFSVAKQNTQINGVVQDLISTFKKLVDLTYVPFRSASGYMGANGTITTASGYHCLYTDKITAEAGDVFYYRGSGRSGAYSAVFFDATNNVLAAEQYDTASTYVAVTCPENTASVRFSSYAASSLDIKFSLTKKYTQMDGLVQDSIVHSNKIAALESNVGELLDAVVVPTEGAGFMNNQGVITGNVQYHCLYTRKIAATEGDKFFYRGVGRSDACSAVFYNSAGTVIDSVKYNTPYNYVAITCPENTASVRFSSFESNYAPVVFSLVRETTEIGELLRDITTHDVLTDKVWYACGDSFTHGDFSGVTEPKIASGKYKGKLAVYPYLIGNRTNCTVNNIAVNGATISQPADTSFVNVFTHENDGLLYTTDFSDADIITLYFGINDSHKSIPIGTIDDSDNATFYGAWNVVMSYLQTNYPNAHIGIIVSNACGSPDYPNAEVAIAQKYGVPYLDLDGGVGCQTMLRCSSRNPASEAVKSLKINQQKVTNTNWHPNASAHQIESVFIENWIKSL